MTAQSASDVTPELGGIAGWAISVIDALGGPGAAFLIALENVFPPLPSEIILPLAGFSAGAGAGFTLIGAIAWCTAGSLVGAFALYALGALLGRERTRKILNSLPLVNPADVVRTEAFFDKHGSKTVFFGRMIPIFRSLISLPAGVTRMSLVRFTLLTGVGSLIWNTILIYAGYALGANWHVVEDYVGVLSKVIIAVVLAALVTWIALRIRKNRRPTDTTSTDHLADLGLKPRESDQDTTPSSPGAHEESGRSGRDASPDSKPSTPSAQDPDTGDQPDSPTAPGAGPHAPN